MPDTPKTPGEIAYAAYWHGAGLPYALLPAYEQANWEAAAQAVLARVRLPPTVLDLYEAMGETAPEKEAP